MTNYALDQQALFDAEGTGASSNEVLRKINQSQAPNSPSPDTKSPIGRGKGTQALIQKAQQDPNSFLHTQPIHFDNYYVQARPLEKTIFGNQYKQAREKVKQQRKKDEKINKLRANSKKQSKQTIPIKEVPVKKEEKSDIDIVMINTLPSVVSTASVDLKGAMAIEKLVEE